MSKWFFGDRTLWQFSNSDSFASHSSRIHQKFHQTLSISEASALVGACLMAGDDLPHGETSHISASPKLLALAYSTSENFQGGDLYDKQTRGCTCTVFGKSMVSYNTVVHVRDASLHRSGTTAASLRDPVELEANSEPGTRGEPKGMNLRPCLST